MRRGRKGGKGKKERRRELFVVIFAPPARKNSKRRKKEEERERETEERKKEECFCPEEFSERSATIKRTTALKSLRVRGGCLTVKRASRNRLIRVEQHFHG